LTRIAASDAAPLDNALRHAATALGYPTADDYHALGATGISRAAFTFRDGRRVSTNDDYLEPARSRPNLTVRGDVHVDRVALEGRHAVGVVSATGEEIAATEVVLSAGAIHSPTILLWSGIGPETGLAVGANLIDHASTAGFEVTLNQRGRQRSADLPVLDSIIRYTSGLADAGANDMQIAWFVAVGNDEASLAGGRVLPSVMRVFSRGEVRLRSADPLDQPDVNFRMLSDERDRVRLCDGVRRVIELVHDPAVTTIAST
jgi:5-(hydroxymethyl)furfural/furfural oxidase